MWMKLPDGVRGTGECTIPRVYELPVASQSWTMGVICKSLRLKIAYNTQGVWAWPCGGRNTAELAITDGRHLSCCVYDLCYLDLVKRCEEEAKVTFFTGDL